MPPRILLKGQRPRRLTSTQNMNTDTPLDIAVLQAECSQQSVVINGVTITPAGYYLKDGKRIGLKAAEALVNVEPEAPAPEPTTTPTEKRQPKRTGFTWDSLNAATQALFFRLAEQIQTATQDGDQLQSVRLGHDIPKIELVDAPRLSSLKKAGLLETFEGVKKSYRHLRLTDAGRELWASTVGA